MQIRSLLILVFSLLCMSVPALYAVEPVAKTDKNDNVAQLLTRTKQLESEVSKLKAELGDDENDKKTSAPANSKNSAPAAKKTKLPKILPVYNYFHHPTTVSEEPANYKPPKKIPIVVEGKKFLVRRIHIPSPIYFGGTPVITSPYLGIRSEFDGTDLITNIPGVNEDLRILRQMMKLHMVYAEHGIPYPNHPYLELSGKVEGQSYIQTPYTGNRVSDINLVSAELDTLPIINQWAFGLITFNFDNSSPTTGPLTREFNSRVFVAKAFLTVGNLCYTPFYGSIGQMVVPFGVYSSNMLSAPLTSFISKTLQRALLLGYSQGDTGLYSSAYTFRGDSGTGGSTGHINNGGVNLGYIYKNGPFSMDVGTGWIANITDSLGMQTNGQPTSPPQFAGFAVSSATEVLNHRVPGYNLRGSFTLGDWGLIAEYVGAMTQYSYPNLYFDGHGARPSAANIEGSYNFKTVTLPSSIAVGYQVSNQALALNIPRQRYITAYNLVIMKDTIATAEYRHDINYPASNFAGGTGSLPFLTNGQTGHTSDTFTVQFGIYF